MTSTKRSQPCSAMPASATRPGVDASSPPSERPPGRSPSQRWVETMRVDLRCRRVAPEVDPPGVIDEPEAQDRPVIRLDRVEARRGKAVALSEIDLSTSAGSVTAIIGPTRCRGAGPGAERGAELSVLISDLVITDMSGRDVATHITELRSELPVLYVSRYTDSDVACPWRERRRHSTPARWSSANSGRQVSQSSSRVR